MPIRELLAIVLRSTAFRSAVAVAAAVTVCTVLLFAFIYWQTALSETQRVDRFIVDEAHTMAAAPPEQVLWIVRNHLVADLHRVTFASLFDGNGQLIEGNMEQLPRDLAADGRSHWVDAIATDAGGSHRERVIAVAQRLQDGRLLVIGRNIDALSELRHLVARALVLGVIPALLLALGAGALIGERTWRRVRTWEAILRHVRDGHFTKRLPIRGSDDVDHLAAGVNHVLDEVERLLGELHNVGNNIAHDLRTPLARVRASLERARRGAPTCEELQQTIDNAIAGIDQSISITTSLLRLAEIEGSRRRDAFAPIDLVEIVREVAEFYEPAADGKHIALRLDLAERAGLYGDRDLLFEAVANLVDNAVKFTPEGGVVRVRVSATANGLELRVADSGSGIPADRRNDVFKRFFRSDNSRNAPGTGLGLSLVAAIAKLHGYTLTIEDGKPGCIVIMQCAGAVPELVQRSFSAATS